MKRRLVKILIGFVALLALVVVAAVGILYGYYPRSRPAPTVTAPTTPEAIERGRYLANAVAMCMSCHSEVDRSVSGDPIVAGKLGAGREFDDEFPGKIRAPNITSDPEVGLGAWSDGEIVRAVREGIDRHGRPLFPIMPYGNFAQTLSDEDALSIVSYLRTLPPIKNDPGPFVANFPVSMFGRAAPKPVLQPVAAAPTDPTARGDWLLVAASCDHCHSASPFDPPYAGGMAVPVKGGIVYSSNITSDKATGIGAYTDEDLLRVFNEGIGKSGQKLYGMPWLHFKQMTDSDKQALVGAIKRIPAVANVVPPATIQR